MPRRTFKPFTCVGPSLCPYFHAFVCARAIARSLALPRICAPRCNGALFGWASIMVVPVLAVAAQREMLYYYFVPSVRPSVN